MTYPHYADIPPRMMTLNYDFGCFSCATQSSKDEALPKTSEANQMRQPENNNTGFYHTRHRQLSFASNKAKGCNPRGFQAQECVNCDGGIQDIGLTEVAEIAEQEAVRRHRMNQILKDNTKMQGST